MDTTLRKTARDTIIVSVANILTFTIGLIQLPLLTKNLGPEGYGLWSQSLATVSLILPFTNLGLGTALVRFLAGEKKKEEIQEGFYSTLLVSLSVHFLIALLVFALSVPLADNFFDGSVQVVRLTAALLLVMPVSTLFMNLIRTFRQITKYSLITIAETGIQLGVLAFLATNDYGVNSIILSLLGIRVGFFLYLFLDTVRQIGIRRPHFTRLKEYLKYGLPLSPRSIAFWLVNLSDRYVIGYFLGTASVGIYAAAYGIGSLPYAVTGTLTFVLLATISKSYDQNRLDEVKVHIDYTLKYFLAIIIPFLFGSGILAEPVLRLFSTAEIAREGRFIVPIIALAVSLLGLHNITMYSLMLKKKTGWMAIIWVAAAALNIGLNIVLVPSIGIMGAALTTLLAYTLGFIFVSYLSYKALPFTFPWKFILKSLLASAVMSGLVWFLNDRNFSVTLTVIFGVVLYAAVLLLAGGFSKTEFRFFLSLVRRDKETSSYVDEQ